MTALRGWCTSPSVTANPPFQSRQAQLESGVRGNVPAPFGVGERLQSPTYRYLWVKRHLPPRYCLLSHGLSRMSYLLQSSN